MRLQKFPNIPPTPFPQLGPIQNWPQLIELPSNTFWCVIVQVQTGNLSLKIVQYCIYIIVFALVKALERVQKLRCNDKIFILAINTLSSVCSMLITATFYVMGKDINTLKTSHDSLISIAVIVKTYNICSKSIRESFTCNT